MQNMISNIEENIRIHGKFQFEMKYVYPLDCDIPVTEYTLEHFLLIQSSNFSIS